MLVGTGPVPAGTHDYGQEQGLPPTVQGRRGGDDETRQVSNQAGVV